jgi:hypothetical protein
MSLLGATGMVDGGWRPTPLGWASCGVRVYSADRARAAVTARGGRRTSLPEQLGQMSAISLLHMVQNVHS